MSPHPKHPHLSEKNKGFGSSSTLEHLFMKQNCFGKDFFFSLEKICVSIFIHVHPLSVYGEISARICLVCITVRHVCCVYYVLYYVKGVSLCTCTARTCPAHRHTGKLKPAGFAESLPSVLIYVRLLTLY